MKGIETPGGKFIPPTPPRVRIKKPRWRGLKPWLPNIKRVAFFHGKNQKAPMKGIETSIAWTGPAMRRSGKNQKAPMKGIETSRYQILCSLTSTGKNQKAPMKGIETGGIIDDA